MKFLVRYRFRWSLIAAVAALLTAVLLYVSLGGFKVETDILASLPRHDPVLADAYRVIRHLPVQDRLVIDVEIRGGDRDTLAAAGDLIEADLRESGLFKRVGMQQMEALFPELVDHVVAHLPLLFDGPELEAKVAPLLAPDRVRQALDEDMALLQGLEGIGQAGLIARDPLGLRNLVLARMGELMPAREGQLHRGKILSRDGRHLLVIAELAGSATDTAYTKAIPPLVALLAQKLAGRYQHQGIGFTLTPVGAYRAALDNETAARQDMRRAVGLTTLGIALLLLLTFPRPLIGLLALIPSTVGAALALLVCSFLFPSLSILAVGFGGAIMAFTVDLGITYLLFLDRPAAVSGKQAAREVQSGEVLAALTTIGGFLLLLISRFRVLAEIGVFAALGVAFAFAFVHWVFPRLFPEMPPALKPRNRRLGPLLDRACLAGGKARLVAAALFAVVMLFFARPVFQVDIQAMNSLSPGTVAAEQTVQRVWGNLASRVYVLTEGRDLRELQAKAGRLAALFAEDAAKGVLGASFSLSDLFPGEELAKRRAADWQAFWTPQRVADLRRELADAGRESGFSPGAFAAFAAALTDPVPAAAVIPEGLAPLLGITAQPSSAIHLASATPGPAYSAEAFFSRYTAGGTASLFDAGLFNRRLGEVLVALFTEIAVITGIGIILVVFFFFLDLRLTLIVLAPVCFALISTLGTLKLIGHPVDIPGIMLWIVIMGMGIDYGIYYVCACQRHLDEQHPSMTLIRQAVFLAGTTTLIGFGVLAAANHAVLRSIGLTSLFGIGYSLLGAFLIVPPLARRVLTPAVPPPEELEAGSARHRERTLLRYRVIETTPRLFARGKLRFDPMFPRLAALVGRPQRILDIGCGYGIPAAWLLELFPQATVVGIDPDAERVRIAGLALGTRGEVLARRAPELGDVPGGADTALVLDIIHMLSDTQWAETLGHLHAKLLPGGLLVVRATIPRDGRRSWLRRIEELRLRRCGLKPCYRSRDRLEEMIRAAGFGIDVVEEASRDSEEVWFTARRGGDRGSADPDGAGGDPSLSPSL
jgi:predicted exporter/SAM-dependent methyltransferase